MKFKVTISPVGAELFHADRQTVGRTGMTDSLNCFLHKLLGSISY
jgi:hypothetical protein